MENHKIQGLSNDTLQTRKEWRNIEQKLNGMNTSSRELSRQLIT